MKREDLKRLRISMLQSAFFAFILALLIYKDSGLFYHGFLLDFEGIRLFVTSALFVLGGIVLGLFGTNPLLTHGDMICGQCERVFPKNTLRRLRCPKCKVRLEELELFYDRHPEKRAPAPPEEPEPVTPEPEKTEPEKPAFEFKMINMGILETLREYRTPAPRPERGRTLSGQRTGQRTGRRSEGAAAHNENATTGHEENS
ncbi:MAG: hypothetical protein AB7E32_09695 [Desulfovibrio sp.]